MDYSTYIPIWNKLTDSQRASLTESAREVHYRRGDFIHNGDDCMWHKLFCTSGQFSAYTVSEGGRVDVYKRIMEESAPLANFTNEVMASRFSDVMWLIEQIMWKSFDKRLADFLLNESNIEGTNVLRIKHETIGNHM